MSPTPDATLRAQAQEQLQRYLRQFPDETTGLTALRQQLASDTGDLFSRQNMVGHITTSALLWDAAADALLVIHHQALDRWLQPGGHHEGQDGLQASAAREATEETGVSALSPWPWAGATELPLDIDSHAIPARPAKGESAHVHHDFIYLFSASATTPLAPQWAEVKGARWITRAEFAALPEARFARLARKLDDVRAKATGQTA